MSVYIVKENGVEVNRIEASAGFMEVAYPDSADYELVPEPVAVLPTHLENFTTEQMHESFTSDEAIAGLASTNPLVRAQAELLSMKRNKPMNKDDQGYQDAINLLESDGVLDASAATDYRLGIPVYRI